MLQALIADVEAVRFTPAGVPALNLRLQHMSQVEEVGTLRSIDVLVKSVAFGTVAERLTKQALGSEWKFQGFVASPRNSKQLVFHIQDFFQV